MVETYHLLSPQTFETRVSLVCICSLLLLAISLSCHRSPLLSFQPCWPPPLTFLLLLVTLLSYIVPSALLLHLCFPGLSCHFFEQYDEVQIKASVYCVSPNCYFVDQCFAYGVQGQEQSQHNIMLCSATRAHSLLSGINSELIGPASLLQPRCQCRRIMNVFCLSDRLELRQGLRRCGQGEGMNIKL